MISAVANIVTSQKVSFPQVFKYTPIVQCTPITGAPGSHVIGVSIADLSTKDCTISMLRKDETATSIHWFAMGEILE